MGTSDSEILNYQVNGSEVLDFMAELQAVVDNAVASITTLSNAFAALDDSTSSSDSAIATLEESFATLDETVTTGNADFDALTEALAANTQALNDNTLATDDNAAAVDADTASTNTNAASHNNASSSLDLHKLKMAGLITVVAGLAMAYDAVSQAGDFEAGLTQLVTGAGELQSNLGLVHDSLLKMTVDTATPMAQLEAGLYMIDSAGFQGAQSLQILQAAAEGAKVGNAQLADVANGVTTEMVDYANTGLSASDATNILIATVAQGKTHLQDLSNALSTILPTSAAVGVKLVDVSAAMATMTHEGTDAASASTYLRQLLIALDAPTSKGAAALKSIGLTTREVSDGMKRSLPATLEMITSGLDKKFPESSAIANAEFKKVQDGSETLDEALQNLSNNGGSAYIEALKNIAGGSKQMQGILELTGIHAKTFRDDVANIKDATDKGKGGITGWAAVQDDFNFKMERAHQAFNAFLIQIGEQLLPVLGRFGDWFVKNGIPALQNLAQQFEQKVLPNIKKFGDWFTATALPALEGFWKVLTTKVLPPVESLIGNVLTLVGHFTEWLQKSGILTDALNTLGTIVGTLVGWIADFIGWIENGGPVMWILVGVVGALTAGFLALKTLDMISHFQQLWDKVSEGGGIFKTAFDNFLNSQAPSLKKSLDNAKQSADNAGTAIEDIGTKSTEAATVVESESVTMETDIEAVGTAATTTAEEDIPKIGTSMETEAATVDTESVAMEGSLAAIAGPLGIGAIVAAIPMISQGLHDRLEQMLSDFKNHIDQMVQAAKDKKAAMEAALTYQANLQMDITRAQYGLPSAAQEATSPDNEGMPTVKGAHASGGFDLPSGLSMVGELGPEPAYVPSGTSILPHNSFASIMDSIPLLANATQALASQQHKTVSGSAIGHHGGITIHGDVHLHGVQDVAQLWQQLNEYGGKAGEYGDRGAIVGH